ncbi:DUF302 domain-containing protein [Brevibacillus choshinensis]|uniref:DUF302 domain-containing protein n=1 Tax=Brevibacillus choshinensis TaxID=54911 RepID=UPI002E24B4F9|nr:DUF302 domain-containing protein [Brevibacillus choshinensis]
MLGHNELVGYFLPCKIVVYADQSHVHIGLHRRRKRATDSEETGCRFFVYFMEESSIWIVFRLFGCGHFVHREEFA